METLRIKWQRLIDESGQTCPRCSSTEKELEQAVHTLKQSLFQLGIDVVLEKKTLDLGTFAKNVLESNRIWIGEKSLEEWLGANVSQSICCEICDNSECRTVALEEQLYEVIPAELIIKAALIAASEMLTHKPDMPCCENNT